MAASGDNLVMTINIRIDANNTIPVKVDPKWNVGRLKTEISNIKKIPIDKVRIIFQGREIHDAMTIQHCDLGNNSVLHMASGKPITLDANIEDMPPSMALNQSIRTIPDHYKSQFYVYCKNPICKDVKAGKIRVCCKKCQFGAFEVARDPAGWDDVLLPEQITGQCLSENCDGKYAEFYFKCKAHETKEKETSAPLNLIRPNTNNIPCIICYVESNPVVVWPCNDQHCICLDCFKDYGRSKLSERAFVQHADVGYTLPCSAPDCRESFIKEPHHFHILGDAEYERYHNFGMEEFVLKSGGVLCPSPGCSAPILPDHNERKIRCNCGYIFCRECKSTYHNGPCDQANRTPAPTHVEGDGRFVVDPSRANQARWDQAAKDKIRETTKKCPKCNTPTEKNGGCMHMTCRCGFHWCWVCVNQWNRECQSDHWFGIDDEYRAQTRQEGCVIS